MKIKLDNAFDRRTIRAQLRDKIEFARVYAAQIDRDLGAMMKSSTSVADLDEQVAYQRAFEAVIWSQPAVGVYSIRRGMFVHDRLDPNRVRQRICRP